MIETLKEWSYTLAVTALAGGLSSLIIPDTGAGKTIKQYLKFALSLIVLLVMLAPLKNLFTELPDMLKGNSGFFGGTEFGTDTGELKRKADNLIIDSTSGALEKAVSDAVYKKYGIKPEVVNIYIKKNTNTADGETDIEIEKIDIVISPDGKNNQNGGDIFDEIEKYISPMFLCDVQVSAAGMAGD